MGKITFQSALGGTVDLVGPATAATIALYLPATSGDIVGTGSTGVVTSGMISGQVAVAQGGTGVATSTGTGSVVLNTSPTLVTPALGTPASGVLSNATGLPLTTGVTGILPIANGGSGTATPAIVAGSNVTVSGTWPNQTINSTASGTGTVTSVSTGTGLSGGRITASGTIALANTAVTPGSYTAANITVDAQGRLIAAASGSAGGGTVTSVSVVSANGLAGTVATATSTPSITLSTSVTGVLKGNGTAISAATAGTDYVAPGGALGTPASGTLTNATGLPLTSGVTGVLAVANGGTGNTSGTATINANLTGDVTSVGNAATVVTNANLTGVVTSTGNATAIADGALSIAKTSGLQAAIDGKQPLDAALTALAAGSDFVQFTGPLTTTKIFTLPDASSTLLVSGGALGTPSSVTLTNATGLPLTTGVSGILPVANGGTATATPSIVAGTNVTVTGTWPNQTVNASGVGLGTVTSVAATVPSIFSISGSPITTAGTLAMTYSGTALPVANGGTSLTTLTANNVILGNGASAPTFVAPSTSGNVLTSNGTTWASTAPAASSTNLLENVQTIASNYTFTALKNALAVGPVTINTGISVTVGTGQRWLILN